MKHDIGFFFNQENVHAFKNINIEFRERSRSWGCKSYFPDFTIIHSDAYNSKLCKQLNCK